MGTLRITGIIELDQFWPVSDSDADTTKIKLTVGDNSFEYRENGETNFKVTKVFKDAVSRGQGTRAVIKTSKKTGDQTITVRLQGVDAPELHYRAAPLKTSPEITPEKRAAFNELNKERRQCFAESATVALFKHLQQFSKGSNMVQANFESTVDKPFEVVDTYGRFIGNIFVNDDKNITLWLVENGWCSPAFYTSMSKEEIEAFLAVWKKGKKLKGRTSKSIIKDAGKFDETLLYRKPGTVTDFKTGDDKGKTIMPKIYRRQVAWTVSKKTKIISAGTSFKTQLKKAPDQLILLNDFLSDGLTASTVHALHDFISDENKILKKPEEFIFQEKPGTLVNAKGKKITEWN
jgi:endonuclease YncB( thermonuclease family)